MEKMVKNIKNYISIGKWIVAIISFLWFSCSLLYKFEENFKIIQKSTLRNTIWNIHIPLHDRLESCDSYLELGYNSETKKYCMELLNEYVVNE